MNSKSILRVLLFNLLFASYSYGQLIGTPFAEAAKTKKATLVCLFSETPGYITSSTQGTPDGLLPGVMISFADYIKKNHNIDVTYKYQAFKKDAPIAEIFDNVDKSSDGVFGLVFIFITEERKKKLNLSATIFESPSFLLTANSAPDVATEKEIAEKLKGYTAYANKGNFFEDRFKTLKTKSLPDLKIEHFKSYNVSNIAETIRKDKAMLYVDISGLLSAMEQKLSFKNHKVLQFSTPMGVILSKQNSWKEQFNTFLQSGYTKSSEFKKLVADNLGHRTFNLLNLQSQ